MLIDIRVTIMLAFMVCAAGAIILLYGMRKGRFACGMAGVLLSMAAISIVAAGTAYGRMQSEEDEILCHQEIERKESEKTIATGVHKKLREEEKPYGILLAFDDYSGDTWSDAFELFDEYNVHVTFFINALEPTKFCEDAVKRGHEIGIHTASHVKLTEVSMEEFYEEAIAPLETFQQKGYKITSFAYPYGEYDDWMNKELLNHYRTTRGAWYYRGYSKSDIDNNFIESMSIDNIHYETDEQFRKDMQERLDNLIDCNRGTVVSMFSHSIDRDGDWCVSKERLRILFEEAEKRKIGFYTFQELQQCEQDFFRREPL